MAMSGNRLGDEIKAALDGLSDKTDRAALFRAFANAIVKHIQAHAQVTATVAVASVSAVTPGAGVSGPGTGTATGKVL